MKKYPHTLVVNYLSETLGIKVKATLWESEQALPLNLRGNYETLDLRLEGHPFMLLLSENTELTPAMIDKHLAWFERRCGLRGIFATPAMEAYTRKRLIERKIPFIVPGNQLYIPDLGLDLREHFKKARQSVSKIGPLTQVLTLQNLLQHPESDGFTVTEIASRLPYSKMSMSRSIDELVSAGLAERAAEGRERRVHFLNAGQELWQNARPYMRSPVKTRVYLEGLDEALQYAAGLSALDELTQRNEASRQVWALSEKRWKEIQKSQNSLRIVPEASREDAAIELEIWRYDPGLLSSGRCVDPLSLALSLNAETNAEYVNAIESRIDQLFTAQNDLKIPPLLNTPI